MQLNKCSSTCLQYLMFHFVLVVTQAILAALLHTALNIFECLEGLWSGCQCVLGILQSTCTDKVVAMLMLHLVHSMQCRCDYKAAPAQACVEEQR